MLEKNSLVPYVVEQTSKGERSYDISNHKDDQKQMEWEKNKQ